MTAVTHPIVSLAVKAVVSARLCRTLRARRYGGKDAQGPVRARISAPP